MNVFFKPIKIFWSIVTQKNKTKQINKKSNKRFVGVAEKYLKVEEYLKHIWWELIWEKLMFRMLWNTPKDGLCYLQNDSVSMKVFLLSMHKATDFIWSREAYMSFKLSHIFYRNYWPCLTSSSTWALVT